MQYKVGQSIVVRFEAIDFESGISDLEMIVRKPDGSYLSAIGLTEIVDGSGTGIYEGQFTPDIIGWYWLRIRSVSSSDNKDTRTYFVGTEFTTYPAQEDGNLQDIKTNTDKLDVNLSTRASETTVLNIYTAIDEVETKIQAIADEIDIALSTRASEATLVQVRDYVDGLETTLANIYSQLDVALSTRASESTLIQVRDYLDTVETKLQSIINQLDVTLSTRASESTLIQVRDYLDTVESSLTTIINKLDVNLSTRASESTLVNVKNNLDSILLKLDVALSTRASETTVANIYGQLNITLSALRDAITGVSPNNKTLNDINDTLLLIKAKTDNLDVALSTRATEATLSLIKAKTDYLDVLLSTRLSESDFDNKVGEVQVIPTSYTILGRLKDLWDKLHDLFVNGVAKVQLWDGIHLADITTDGKLNVVVAPSTVNQTIEICWDRPHTAVNAYEWQDLIEYTVPTGYYLNGLYLTASSETSGEKARVITRKSLGTFVGTTDTFTDGSNFTSPLYAARLYLYVTSVVGAGSNDTVTITYTDSLGNTGRTTSVIVPKNSPVGTRLELILQNNDYGVLDVTNITHSAIGQAGNYTIFGCIELYFLVMSNSNQLYVSPSTVLGGAVLAEGEHLYLQYKSATKSTYTRRVSLLASLAESA